MTTTELFELCLILIVLCLVLSLLIVLSKGRFTRAVRKDKFRSRSQIGNDKLGKTNTEVTYRQIAKERNLVESKRLEPKVNPKVTSSIAGSAKEVRESE